MQRIKVSFDTWIQLLGMLGVIGSLIFVAMQMRQSHQFALAAQQQARMEVFVDAVNTMSQTGVSFQEFRVNGISAANQTAIDNFRHQLWWVHENDYLQYSLGLMDENIWEAKLRAIEFLYNGDSGDHEGCMQSKEIWRVRRPILSPDLVALVESIPSAC
jgi:hypothetical protein|tara:strand:- start:83 stop:559 length:477 start_codon:yes stop_codon:yes gene_type:complete